jgi:hypothetical protein
MEDGNNVGTHSGQPTQCNNPENNHLCYVCVGAVGFGTLHLQTIVSQTAVRATLLVRQTLFTGYAALIKKNQIKRDKNFKK